MKYTVKRATDIVEQVSDWNTGQWAQANVLELKNYMGDKPKHFPKTQAKLLYDDENLFVFFLVEDRYVRAVADKTHGNVCRDSCVEFFFTPGCDFEKIYFNLETNCGGTMLFRYNDKKNKIEEYIESIDCKDVIFCHSLPKMIVDEIQEPTTWTLSYKLPFNVISKYSEMTKPQRGIRWKANFYKCADKTSHPHWLTWALVDNLTPDFHLPEYFGVLEFE